MSLLNPVQVSTRAAEAEEDGRLQLERHGKHKPVPPVHRARVQHLHVQHVKRRRGVQRLASQPLRGPTAKRVHHHELDTPAKDNELHQGAREQIV